MNEAEISRVLKNNIFLEKTIYSAMRQIIKSDTEGEAIEDVKLTFLQDEITFTIVDKNYKKDRPKEEDQISIKKIAWHIIKTNINSIYTLIEKLGENNLHLIVLKYLEDKIEGKALSSKKYELKAMSNYLYYTHSGVLSEFTLPVQLMLRELNYDITEMRDRISVNQKPDRSNTILKLRNYVNHNKEQIGYGFKDFMEIIDTMDKREIPKCPSYMMVILQNIILAYKEPVLEDSDKEELITRLSYYIQL